MRAAFALLCALSLAQIAVARADVSVAPEALKHYAYCVGEAKDHGEVIPLERQVLYRCRGEIAVSYFNYLERRRAPLRVVEEVNGLFQYRTIEGVGRCWRKIADEARLPAIGFGCDIYVEI
jgi:hypothetical protein